MNISYVISHTIFETIVGSQAYGLSTPESDVDKAGVMIPGKEFFLGLNRFDQFQGFLGEDHVVYDIRKALRLMGDCNPNMLDLLFVPDRCIKIMTPYWEKIREHRDLFVSLKCKFTFSGYAISQLERIKTHRKFILNPALRMPLRADFGLPEDTIFPTAQLKSLVCTVLGDFFMEESKEDFLNELDGIYGDYIMPLFYKFVREDRRKVAIDWLQISLKSQVSTLRAVGPKYLKDEYIEMAEKELQFYNAQNEWDRYQQWQKTRNKKRADLEAKYGFDCKHAMHLIRLIRMCKEILETGHVNVDRSNIDAEELLSIKNGAWKYEKIEEYTLTMNKVLDDLYKTSKLQKSSQINHISQLCTDVCGEYLFNRKAGEV